LFALTLLAILAIPKQEKMRSIVKVHICIWVISVTII